MTSTDRPRAANTPGTATPLDRGHGRTAMVRTRSVIVTGGGGQLARDLTERFTARGWTVAAPVRTQLDVTDRRAVLDRIGSIRPDVVINAAAWTNPQGCEDDPARAWSVHAMAVRHLAEACRKNGTHLCQISTDYVFDGSRATSHTEWDPPSPTSVYGRSKLAGEHEVPDGATIVRTSRLISRHGNNVGRNVLRLARKNPDQKFGFDAYHKGCVTFTADLASLVETLVAERLPGMYHATNQGVTTWYEFARAVLSTAGENPDRVRPIDGDQATGVLARPEHSVLENVALSVSGIAPLPDWKASLESFVGSLDPDR